MSEDEGRLVSSKEARLRKAARRVKFGDQPKTKMQIQPLVKSSYKSPYERAYTARIEVGTNRNPAQSVAHAQFKYRPENKDIKVGNIFPERYGKRAFNLAEDQYNDIHKEVANKVLPTAATKDIIAKTSKMFPKADELTGERMTGLRKASESKNLSRGRSINTKAITQKFNLAGVRRRLGRMGKVGKALGLGMAAYDAYRGSE